MQPFRINPRGPARPGRVVDYRPGGQLDVAGAETGGLGLVRDAAAGIQADRNRRIREEELEQKREAQKQQNEADRLAKERLRAQQNAMENKALGALNEIRKGQDFFIDEIGEADLQNPITLQDMLNEHREDVGQKVQEVLETPGISDNSRIRLEGQVARIFSGVGLQQEQQIRQRLNHIYRNDYLDGIENAVEAVNEDNFLEMQEAIAEEGRTENIRGAMSEAEIRDANKFFEASAKKKLVAEFPMELKKLSSFATLGSIEEVREQGFARIEKMRNLGVINDSTRRQLRDQFNESSLVTAMEYEADTNPLEWSKNMSHFMEFVPSHQRGQFVKRARTIARNYIMAEAADLLSPQSLFPSPTQDGQGGVFTAHDQVLSELEQFNAGLDSSEVEKALGPEYLQLVRRVQNAQAEVMRDLAMRNYAQEVNDGHRRVNPYNKGEVTALNRHDEQDTALAELFASGNTDAIIGGFYNGLERGVITKPWRDFLRTSWASGDEASMAMVSQLVDTVVRTKTSDTLLSVNDLDSQGMAEIGKLFDTGTLSKILTVAAGGSTPQAIQAMSDAQPFKELRGQFETAIRDKEYIKEHDEWVDDNFPEATGEMRIQLERLQKIGYVTNGGNMEMAREAAKFKMLETYSMEHGHWVRDGLTHNGGMGNWEDLVADVRKDVSGMKDVEAEGLAIFKQPDMPGEPTSYLVMKRQNGGLVPMTHGVPTGEKDEFGNDIFRTVPYVWDVPAHNKTLRIQREQKQLTTRNSLESMLRADDVNELSIANSHQNGEAGIRWARRTLISAYEDSRMSHRRAERASKQIMQQAKKLVSEYDGIKPHQKNHYMGSLWYFDRVGLLDYYGIELPQHIKQEIEKVGR